MKLLFDQNLSPELVRALSDLFPESIHVMEHNLSSVLDSDIWLYAREKNYIIVSKDSDFSEMSIIRGYPPKVIWIRRGNCSTKEIEHILRSHYDHIKRLHKSKKKGILLLY